MKIHCTSHITRIVGTKLQSFVEEHQAASNTMGSAPQKDPDNNHLQPPIHDSKPQVLQEKNILSTTIKTIQDSTNTTLHRGRLVISNSEAHMVRLCGMLTNIEKEDRYTDLTFYDGTGAIKGRIWPGSLPNESDLSPTQLNKYFMILGTPRMLREITVIEIESARLVTDHNDITQHMLRTIYEHLDLEQRIKTLPTQTSTSTKDTKENEMKAAVQMLLTKAIVRDSEAGASFKCIMQNVGMDTTTAREILSSLLRESKIYQTTDYMHFKSCID